MTKTRTLPWKTEDHLETPAAAEAIAAGAAEKVFTKRLRRRFSPLQFRNFSSYARRSAKAFGPGAKITN